FGAGIYLWFAASNNMIGGLTNTPGTGPGNIISASRNAGVILFMYNSTSMSGNVLEGNLIGLGANGTSMGNGSVGVLIRGGVTNTTIGGTAAGAANVISANSGASIATSDPSTGNFIRGSSSYGIGGSNIDVIPSSRVGDGVTRTNRGGQPGGTNLHALT